MEGAGHLSIGGRNWAPGALKGEGEDYLQVKDWDVAQGRLTRPFDVTPPTHHVYHLIVAEEKLARPEVAEVREWLLEGARV